MLYTRRKTLIVTFIPQIAWLISGIWFTLYSQGIFPELIGKMSQDIVCPPWAFMVISLPLSIGATAICYIVMVTKEIEQKGEVYVRMMKK
jgi:hypothetical protein